MASFVSTQPVTTSIVNFVNTSGTSFVNDRANCGFPSVAMGSFKHTPPLTLSTIKCTPPLAAAIASSATSRSFVNDRDCGFSTIAAAGRQLARIKRTPPPPLTPKATSRSFVIEACGLPVDGGNDEIVTGGEKEIDFAAIFRNKDKDGLSFEFEFTGEVEKQYLDYIAKLDFEPFHDHVRKFPRKRSEVEKKAIFDRYVELYDRQYVTEELKGKRYGYFKSTLDWIDQHNAKNPNLTYGITITDDLIPCDEQPPQSYYTSSSFPPGEARNSIFFRPGHGLDHSGLFVAPPWDLMIGDMDFEEFCKSERSEI